MTLDEVLAKECAAMSSVRPQVFIRSSTTLKSMRDKGVVSGTDRYNAFTQDKIAEHFYIKQAIALVPHQVRLQIASRVSGLLPVVKVRPWTVLSSWNSSNRARITADTFESFSPVIHHRSRP